MATAVVLVGIGAGCSSFRHDVRVATKRGEPPPGIEGVWEGRWQSDKDPGHGGAMQMVLTRTGDTLYRASSRSRWWRIFRSSYDTHLVVTPVSPGEYLIRGGRHLWAFGDHSLTGRVDSARLEAGYRVGRHAGTIVLARPGSGDAK